MHLCVAVVAALAAGSFAQNLSAVVSADPNLSDLATILAKYTFVQHHIGMANGVTFLAPANGPATKKLLQFLDTPAAKTPGVVETLLSYHVLKGVTPAAQLPATAFIETYVHDAKQRVHLVKAGSKVSFYSGGNAQVNVVQADIKFNGPSGTGAKGGGIIHVIDGVLSVPEGAIATASGAGLSALVKNLDATGLSKTVESLKEVTIFAPTNAAFSVATSVLASLSPAQVSSALRYHVVKGLGYSTDLKDGQTLTTVQGGKLTVKISGGNVFINGAKVLTADVLARNAVVHVIDKVLVPSS